MSESREQVALANWLDRSQVLWCHPPNGGQRTRLAGAKLKGQGAKAGVPDVLIFTPPPRHPGARGVAVELKVGKGRVSQAQRQWLTGLQACGWLTLVAYGWLAAADWLTDECGYGR